MSSGLSPGSRAVRRMTDLVAPEEPSQRLHRGRQVLDGLYPQQLRLKLQDGNLRVPWLGVIPPNTMDGVCSLPASPTGSTVMAADGSSTGLDRHGPARQYVINIGGAAPRWNCGPAA